MRPLGLGFIIGLAIGGLLGELGTRIPFYAAAALSLLNMLHGFFVLKESLSLDKRRQFTFRRANPWAALVEVR